MLKIEIGNEFCKHESTSIYVRVDNILIGVMQKLNVFEESGIITGEAYRVRFDNLRIDILFKRGSVNSASQIKAFDIFIKDRFVNDYGKIRNINTNILDCWLYTSPMVYTAEEYTIVDSADWKSGGGIESYYD